MLLKNIAIFVPPQKGTLPPPNDRPITRAVDRLLKEDIQCIFGFSFERIDESLFVTGLCCSGATWTQQTNILTAAVYDRFPSQLRNQDFQQMLEHIAPSPMGNPYSFTMLCRDKIKTQVWLEQNGIKMPVLETDPARFQARLKEWKMGFIKPQFGALGTSVHKVDIHSPLPAQLPSLDPSILEPAILQRAITAPKGFAGMSVRCLIQRQDLQNWIVRTPVLRHSTEDPVVNVARGAQACAAQAILPSSSIDSIYHQAKQIGLLINDLAEGHLALECGIDFVIDSDFSPWIVELNSRPRGRLEYLAATAPTLFYEEHIEALAQPIRYLAQLTRRN